MIKFIVLHYFFSQRNHIVREVSANLTAENDIHIICHSEIGNQKRQMGQIIFPHLHCPVFLLFYRVYKLFQCLSRLITQNTGRAVSICTSSLSAVALFSTRDKNHMAKLSCFLIFSRNQSAVNAESSSQCIVQRKIHRIFILVSIFRHHCRIGIIFKRYGYGKCLFQKAQTVVFHLERVRFDQQFFLLVDNSWYGNADSKDFFSLFHIREKFSQFFRYPKRIRCFH